jgi:hypothetical protein
MAAKIVKKFLMAARSELSKYPNQYSIGGLFLWGAAILLFSINLNRIWLAVLYLMLAHILTASAVYVGFIKNVRGKRTPLAITVGLIILLLTLLIDTLFVISS